MRETYIPCRCSTCTKPNIAEKNGKNENKKKINKQTKKNIDKTNKVKGEFIFFYFSKLAVMSFTD